MADRSPRVLVVCSAGGHLMEALRAIEGVAMNYDLATFRLPHLKPPEGARSVHYLTDPHVSLWKYVVNAVQSFLLMLKLRPQVLVTTGAGIAIACALIGKLMGTKLIFVETAAVVGKLSRTGALLYCIADLFIVQWPEIRDRYPRAVYGGCTL